MEGAISESNVGVSDDAQAPSRDRDQSRPLPSSYRLPFFNPFCYSPYGTSPLAQRSRRLRDQVKRADSATLCRCAARVAAMIDAEVAPHFQRSDVAFVPVPPRTPCAPHDGTSAPVAIARALHNAGLGRFIRPALYRARPIPESPGRDPARGRNFSTTTRPSSSLRTIPQWTDSFWLTTS